MKTWLMYRFVSLLLRMLAFSALLLMAACATTPRPMQIRAQVDALAVNDANAKHRFVILPANKELNPQDLQFIEFKGYVEKALKNRGYIKTEILSDADVVLFLSYGVGEPQMQQYAYDVPIWDDFGYYPYSRRYRFYPRATYGFMGYTQQIETYTVFRRYLVLEAYDMDAYLNQKTPIQHWKVSVQSLGQSNDLRQVFPYLVTAMQPHMGSNTGHMLTVDIDEFNPLLRDILLGNPNRLPMSSPAAPP